MEKRVNVNYGKFIIHLFFIALSIGILIPFVLVISVSLTDEKALLADGYRLFPEKISAIAYELILSSPGQMLQAYAVTAFVTVVGTVVGLLLTAMTAYVISRRNYRYGKITTFYVFFTMLFTPGLVPIYMLVTQYLHLKDSIWALIFPYLLNPFFILIMKGFLDKIPVEVIESAKMDGAHEIGIFSKIILPLSTPALATVGLFIAFMYWNDWWLGLLFIDNQHLVPLQLLLYRVMNTIEFLSNNINNNLDLKLEQFPSLSARMVVAVLAAGPMMFIFPFFQRHFVEGLTVGSIKG